MEVKQKFLKPWHRIVLVFFPYIIIVGILQSFGLFLTGASLTDLDSQKTTFQHLITDLFSFIGTIFILWLFMKIFDNEPFVNLGLHLKKRLLDVILGICLGFFIMSIGYLILIYTDKIFYIDFQINFKEIITTALVFILVALIEEIFFRGYIQRNLMYSFNKYIALVISSTLFAIMHGFNPNINLFSIVNLYLAGVLLGISYLYTKNLWFCIGLHFSWNFFQTIFGFNVSGIDFYSIINFKLNEENIFNGGDFGFEGSIFSLILQSLCILYLMFHFKFLKIDFQKK